MQSLRISADAEADLLALARAATSPALVEEFRGAFRQLAEFPESGHLHRDLPSSLRVLQVGRWLVVHRLRGDFVEVARIVHGSQDLRRIEF